MEAFDSLKTLIEQRARQMIEEGKKEIEVDIGMTLVEIGTPEETEHNKKGSSILSVHRIDNRSFLLFSS